MSNHSSPWVERLKRLPNPFGFIIQFRNRIHQINLKYANPRIQMTPMVKLSLLLLRLYLIVLVVLLFYRFITLVR
jgi:hypothetical protein